MNKIIKHINETYFTSQDKYRGPVCGCNSQRALGEKSKMTTNSFHKANLLISNTRASFVVLTVRAETTLLEHFSIFVDIFLMGQ